MKVEKNANTLNIITKEKVHNIQFENEKITDEWFGALFASANQ